MYIDGSGISFENAGIAPTNKWPEDILKRHENHSQCWFARLSSIAVDTGDLEVLVDIS